MSDRTEIIELVDTIFDTVDAKNWDAAEALFDSKVTADFTSLNGGEPAENLRHSAGGRLAARIARQEEELPFRRALPHHR